MRKILFLIGTPAVVVTIGLAFLLLIDDAPLTPRAPTCGVALGPDLGPALGLENAATAEWSIYTFDGSAEAPRILVREREFDDLPAADLRHGCEMEIRAMSPSTARGQDWRIGFTAPVSDALRGQTVTASFYLAANEPTRLGSGTAYLHDGKTISGVPVRRISESWDRFEVTHTIAEDATTFEMWFRLLIDRPDVSPSDGTIRLAAQLDRSLQPAKKPGGDGFTPATCPLFIEDAGAAPTIAEEWSVYRFEGSGAPKVAVSSGTDDAAAPGEPTRWCQLDVTNAPTSPGSAMDWRIGHAISADKVRGKNVRFSADLRASLPTRLSSATLYTYDGETVSGIPITELTMDWQTLEVPVKVPANAETFEMWLRLVIDDGTITPAETNISFVPKLAIGR